MDNLTAELFPSKHPRKIYSVTQINQIVRATLENFSGWVHGEVAELEKIKTRFNTSFLKFKLKDEVTNYTLPAIVWPEVANNLDFELVNGVGVVTFGNLSLYEKTGIYQFQAQLIELFGEGLLQKKFEELKKKLRNEGLFDEKYKKPLIKYPIKIGVITSETSAAWIDFKKHTSDHFPFLEILLADVFVQGEKAVPDLVWAMGRLNEEMLDVIVLTRGGGSAEDLAAFNTEEVARAIAASPIPVICAVGHERDETIADWVADVRASTPTAAARLITGNFEEFLTKARYYPTTIKSQTLKLYQTKLLEISLLEKGLKTACQDYLGKKKNLVEDISQEFPQLPAEIFKRKNQILETFSKQLELLSPQRVLERGYSVTYKLPEIKIVRNVNDTPVSAKIKVRLAKGELIAKVVQNIKN